MPSVAELLLRDINEYFGSHPEGEHHVSQGQQLQVFLSRFQKLKLGEQYRAFNMVLTEDHPVCDQVGFLILCLTHTMVSAAQKNTEALLLAAYRENAQAPRARMVRAALRELTFRTPAPTASS